MTASSATTCPVCSVTFPPSTNLRDIEIHVDDCLGKNRTDTINEEKCCPICSNTFHPTSTLMERQSHINRCLDDEDKDPMLRQNYECPICGQRNLTDDALERIRHVKNCGRKFGVTASDLNSLSPPSHETTVDGLPRRPIVQQKQEGYLDLLLNEADQLDIQDAMAAGAINNNNNKENILPTPPHATKQMKITSFFHSHQTTTTSNITPTTPHPPISYFGIPESKRIPDTNLLVDAFEFCNPAITSHYLLSHFHADHYVGLTKSFNAGYIYCSPTTARLVAHSLGVSPKRLCVLNVNHEHMIAGHRVVALPAYHCPGSIMFLVTTQSGTTHLHTGDCRCCTALLTTVLSKLGGGKVKIHTLLLDTTYADPRFDFPTQEHTVAEVRRLLTETGAFTNQKTLILFGAYTIGKEKVALGTVMDRNERLGVTKARLKHVRMMDELSLAEQSKFTSDLTCTRFWIVSLAELRNDKLETLLRRHSSRFTSLVAVRATGWVAGHHGRVKRNTNGTITVISVPYSEHSSYSELVEALKILRPIRLVPTVAETKRKGEDIVKRLMHAAAS